MNVLNSQVFIYDFMYEFQPPPKWLSCDCQWGAAAFGAQDFSLPLRVLRRIACAVLLRVEPVSHDEGKTTTAPKLPDFATAPRPL